MKVWDRPSDYCSGNPARHILEELDELFAADWTTEMDRAAALTAALASDGALLKAFVRTHCDSGEWPELNGAQSFLVMTTSTMLVRLNLWPGATATGTGIEGYRRYLSIDELHNHEFNFFTTCLFGPGYGTTFFRDPAHHGSRIRGDHVELDYLGSFTLGRGPVLYVERGSDYHLQHWPDRFSMTVNVIPRDYERKDRIQYVLDEKHVVKTVIDGKMGNEMVGNV